MKPADMTLTELGKTLRKSFVMHMKLDKGRHLYEYAILAGSTRIGTISKSTQRGTVLSVIYTLIGDERGQSYATSERFLTAYQKRLRDADFEASAPKESE